MAKNELEKLKSAMRASGIDAYVMKVGDCHGSEGAAAHFRFLEYVSGFTGSRGLLIVTACGRREATGGMGDCDAAGASGLWTDSRYFLQAEAELCEAGVGADVVGDDGVTLYKEGTDGVISPAEFLRHLQKSLSNDATSCEGENFVVALDGQMFSRAEVARLLGEGKSANESDATTISIRSVDLAPEVWQGRPEISPQPVRVFQNSMQSDFKQQKNFDKENSAITLSAVSNLEKIRAAMRERGCNFHIMQTLDDIAWTLGLRGGDVPHVPVFYSYLVVGLDEAWLFAYEEAFACEKKVKRTCENCSTRFGIDPRNYLEQLGVRVMPYEKFFGELPGIVGGGRVMLNPASASYELFEIASGCAKIVSAPEPSINLKARKCDAELDGFSAANILDGVAMCKFLCWVKSRDGSASEHSAEGCLLADGGKCLTEISVAEKLHEIRAGLGALDESFDTIAAYGAHGAVVHYSATPASNAKILPKGFLLVDSGAHYEGAGRDNLGGADCDGLAGADCDDAKLACGTTDITRTIAMGPLTDEEKLHYTLVLMGHIDYAMAVFPEGTTFDEIDGRAHQHLRKHGLDYYHGTSHGIGHVLSVHESLGSLGKKNVIQPGMVLSDEPGIYIEGSHGIRIEGDVVCAPASAPTLGFEMLTLCPYERDAIIISMLSDAQLDWLNSYHARVRELLAPHLGGAELSWLLASTEEL